MYTNKKHPSNLHIMTDTKVKCAVAKEVTLADIMNRLNSMEELVKVLFDGIGLKLESMDLTPTPPKRVVTKKSPKTGAAKIEKPPVNAMYWWRRKYAEEDDIIKPLYTDEDVKTAEANCTKIKAKATDYDKRSAIGQLIYSTFNDKKKKQIKGMFDTWKKEQVKATIKTVEKEPSTDDEKKEAPVEVKSDKKKTIRRKQDDKKEESV